MEDNNMQTSIYPDKEIYNKAKNIWNLMKLQDDSSNMNLNKFVNQKLKEYVEDNKELLEKAEKIFNS